MSDPALTARLDEILDVNLCTTTCSAWELGPDGHLVEDAGERGIDTHQRLKEMAGERSRGER